MSNSSVKFNEQQKGEFLGNAYAYLFPIDWPEPFGLTMIESMACGTPTIAFRCGSVPEVITDGLSGFYRREHGRCGSRPQNRRVRWIAPRAAQNS